MYLIGKTNSNVYEIYGKAPLNNSANKWGAWWGFGDLSYKWPVNLLHSQSRAPSLLWPRGFSPT